MTAIEQAIKEAVEKGGYKFPWTTSHSVKTIARSKDYSSRVFLDPLFWSVLGKVRGWGNIEDEPVWTEYSRKASNGESGWSNSTEQPEYIYYWHRFIDHLAEGKSAESFFATL